MLEQALECPICHKPYKVYSHSAADQTACPECVAKASGKSQWKIGR